MIQRGPPVFRRGGLRLGDDMLILVADTICSAYTFVANQGVGRHIMHIETDTYPPVSRESVEEAMYHTLKAGESLFFPHGDTGSSIGLDALKKKMRRAAKNAKGKCRIKTEKDGIRFWLLR